MATARLKVAILGASGRMGQSLLGALRDSDDLELVGALVSPANPIVGQDAGGGLNGPSDVRYDDSISKVLAQADIAIDVSLPSVSSKIIEACQRAGCPLLIGTTGLSDAQRDELATAARSIAVLPAANFSIAMTLMTAMVRQAAKSLGPHWQAAILETHHQNKIDRPSGTALMLAQTIATERGQDPAATIELVESAADRMSPTSVTIESVRRGEVAGEHTVTFADGAEIFELANRVNNRLAFARGALIAARWLSGQEPGLYRMEQLLENPPG